MKLLVKKRKLRFKNLQEGLFTESCVKRKRKKHLLIRQDIKKMKSKLINTKACLISKV